MKLFQTFKELLGFARKQGVEAARESIIHSMFKESTIESAGKVIKRTFDNTDRARLFAAIAELPNEEARRSVRASHARAVEQNKTNPGAENRWAKCVAALNEVAASNPSKPSPLEVFGQLTPKEQEQALTLIENDRLWQALEKLNLARQWAIRKARALDSKLKPLAADIHTRANNALREAGFML